MLPNHASLVVAEQFGMLEALHPGRIDLGIGRAPGTDPVTAAALRRIPGGFGADEFPEQLRDLFVFFDGHPPADHRRARDAGTDPRSGCSVRATTARRSRACSGCRSRSPTTSRRTTRSPRSTCTATSFRPSADLERPYAMIGVPVICAETAEQRALARRAERALVRPAAPGPAHAAADARGGGGVRVHAVRARAASARGPRRSSCGDPDDRARGARRARARAPAPTS